MDLGNFSLSLTVSDLAASRAFYEKLGFTMAHGDSDQGWLIMKHPSCVIGLFHGMFDRNMLTFNPGWDADGQPLKEFTDIRELQKALQTNGVTFISEADEGTAGPASFMITDPDGNPILVDQHV